MSDLKPNINHVTDRRAASAKRANDITPSKWPVVTVTTYRTLFSGKVEDGMDLKMRQLCFGRIRLQQTLLAIDSALHSLHPQAGANQPEVYAALRSIREKVEKEFLRYPLTMVE